jgi:hypothetical protein
MGPQAIATPWKTPAHPAWTVVEHEVPLQQAPKAGCGHGLGEHEPAPSQAFEPVHETWIIRAHAPVAGVQQAPATGCGQGWGEQAVEPFQVFGEPQLAKSTSEHAPLDGSQQAPGEVEDCTVAMSVMVRSGESGSSEAIESVADWGPSVEVSSTMVCVPGGPPAGRSKGPLPLGMLKAPGVMESVYESVSMPEPGAPLLNTAVLAALEICRG